jgi:hypothetical protein
MILTAWDPKLQKHWHWDENDCAELAQALEKHRRYLSAMKTPPQLGDGGQSVAFTDGPVRERLRRVLKLQAIIGVS